MSFKRAGLDDFQSAVREFRHALSHESCHLQRVTVIQICDREDPDYSFSE
jgi:hypothetical protein